MKKLIYTISILLLSGTMLAQTNNNKKWNQLSVRGGLDMATKSNFTQYTKNKLNGFNAGLSFDKYWNWYGLGVDFDFMQNQKSVYALEAGMHNHILTKSWGGFKNTLQYTTTTNATKLSRMFAGIGPSFKYQSKSNKLVAELNLRGGVTLTNGSALYYSTFGNPNVGWLKNMLTRDGDASVVLPMGALHNHGVFHHKGYANDVLGTAKAQVRFNYYVKPKIGINLGGYYNYYWGSAAKYNHLDWIASEPPTSNFWGYRPPGFGLTSLSSMGVTAGVSYRMGNQTTTTKTAKNTIAVSVRDEQTGLPLSGVDVSVVSATGKVYTGVTNATGLVNFEKVEACSYTASGTLHSISTNQQSATVGVGNNNATIALLHNDPRFTVQGKSINLSTNKAEGGVSVSLKNNDKGSVKMGTSQSGSGQFDFQIDANSDYELVGKKASYISNIEKISTKGLNRSQTLYVELQLGVQQVEKGKSITLQNIYYDLDKAGIRQEASSDLEKLTIFLQDNPNFTIEIASHTDSRGSDEYNLKLSQERAQAVVNYLTQRGIDKVRLIAKGYGETMLINKCTNGVTCTEEEHQLNRRTEFKLIN